MPQDLTIPTAKRSTDKISIHIALQGNIYSRLLKMKKAKGVNAHGELIRLAIADFLEKSGY